MLSMARFTDADLTHRQHAVIETVFADLIDGPLAHLPSGLFPANAAWTMLAAIAHNLLRAAGTLIDPAHAVAPRATACAGSMSVPAVGERSGPDRPTPGQT